MYSELTKVNSSKIEEEVLIIGPEGNLESEFFKILFPPEGEITYETIPNSEKIKIRKKVADKSNGDQSQ